MSDAYQPIEEFLAESEKTHDPAMPYPPVESIRELITHAKRHDETIALLYRIVGFLIGEMAVRYGVTLEVDQVMSTLQKEFEMPMYLKKPDEKRIVTL